MAELLKHQGYKLLMDDFGSGYSSLNILLETPFDVIKLDKKFMENMMVSEKGRLILEYVVAMADKLGPVSYTHLDVYKRQVQEQSTQTVLRSRIGVRKRITYPL